MKASAMTTKMVVALFVAIIKQCRYYNRTGYKIIVFNFITKGKQLENWIYKSWRRRARLAAP